ncbi:MAG: histidinol-phosphate transaminase [Candidatus Marinimicrobia bacterium]|nr:histidinol-phosphate transaminase [Candidatus Neomarinimicrobiota bacterium]MDP6877200.1 histidinol-phosphate transaminase [Candidatus Neomarinimicrobiota bacterium]
MPLVPSYIKKLSSYKPGANIDDIKVEKSLKNVVKLASNENSMGSSPLAISAINKGLKKINRYPDASGKRIRKKLAEKFDVKFENVIIGSGSEGIMSNILRTFLLADDEIIGSANSFIGFRVLATATGRKINWVPMINHKIDLEGIKNHINDYTKIIYLANPDNPMGTYITDKEFDEFYKYIPKRVLVILDEAYFEYANHLSDYPNSMIYRYDNVITLRTFSKAYGLAGLRIGYGFSHETLINNLLKVKVPFEPSYIAQLAGLAALDDTEFMNNTIEINRIEKEKMELKLDALKIKRIPSATNFITTYWGSEKNAKEITERVLNKGIILRHLAAFGWPEYIRISIGLESENKFFINILKEII